MVVQMMPKFINLGTKDLAYIINANDIIRVKNLSEDDLDWYSENDLEKPKCLVIVKSMKRKNEDDIRMTIENIECYSYSAEQLAKMLCNEDNSISVVNKTE